MTLENLQFRLASRPVGMAKESDFQQAAEPLRELADGEITVKTLYLSLDPAMRGWMNDAKSYIRPVAIGEVMRAGGVGEVVASKSPKYAVGDIVSGGIGVQAYWQGAADDKSASFFKVDGRLAPLTTWMNTLGMPGMTAYFGLLEVGFFRHAYRTAGQAELQVLQGHFVSPNSEFFNYNLELNERAIFQFRGPAAQACDNSGLIFV